MIRSNLDERHRRILKFVVESHVLRAEPVGSQYVRVAYHLSISPATIRGAMSHLEELGLLEHPHTSAGRVPTELGYRYYVDELMRPGPVAPATRRGMESALDAARTGGEELEGAAARALARASRQLAVVAVRPRSGMPVERLELVALDDGLLLLAVGGSDGPLRTATWQPDVEGDLALVPGAERWIRSRLPAAGAGGLRAMAEAAKREAPEGVARFLAGVLVRAARLLDQIEPSAVRVEGADHIASQPEFQSAPRLRALVSLLAERERLTQALEPFADALCPRVAIGRENGPGAIRNWSLVGRGIEIRGRRGSLGVLGPVRMPYPRLVSLVAYLGERLAEQT
jgi:heat-inducible transcriptional repressor